MKIQYKIVLPFTLLFVLATLLTSLVSLSLMAGNLNERVRHQLDRASLMIARADFAMNSSILINLKSVLGADIVTYHGDGSIAATTLDAATDNDLVQLALSLAPMRNRAGKGEDFVLRETRLAGHPFEIGYRAVASQPDAFIAVIADTSDIAATQKTLTNSLILIAALIVILVSFIGQFVASSVTAPVLRLVESSRKLASGERHQKVSIEGNDEIAILAKAFNEMAEQLRRSEVKLVQSEKLALTGLLAARVAHEVRNPLSAIKMRTQLLRSKLQGDAQGQVASILHEIERVEWVVRGMLDLASSQELELKTDRLITILDEVLEFTSAQLRHRKIVLRKQCDDVPEMMLDSNRLKIAFLNLIMNASEAMPNGGVLEVSIMKNHNSAIVAIEDDGAGIDASIRGRLFNPFVTTKPGGVGLGLVNTKNIVERHHGTITLVARDGGGTRAIIELPLRAERE